MSRSPKKKRRRKTEYETFSYVGRLGAQGLYNICTCLLYTAVLLCGFAIPAYAYSDGGNEEPPVSYTHLDVYKRQMYLGSTGSGKSFAAKRELLNVFLTIPQDRIIVVDPMGEYAPLVDVYKRQGYDCRAYQ